MLRGITRGRRRGSILPLLVISLVAMLGMVALAIDLGMLAVARTHCQAAADAAALAGARTLTGDPETDFNRGAALGNARKAVAENQVIGRPIQNNQVTITIGSYRYDEATDRFVIDPTGRNEGDAWSLCQATVTSSNPAAFARIFNINMLNASATATAAHRPRDVAVVIDFSGSMRLSSLLGAPVTNSTGLSLADRNRAQITENVFPRWGHYSAGSATLRGSTPGAPLLTASGEQIGPSNLVEANNEGPAVIESFFQDNTPFGSSTPAFTRWPDSWQNVPDGLMPRYENGSSSVFAQNVNRVLGRSRDDNSTARSNSAPFIDNQSSSSTTAGYGTAFRDYTAGPRYWGKTFFIWPPDPRGATSNTNVSANNGARDWRQRFFIQIYLGTTDTTSTSTSTTGPTGGSGGGSSGSGGSSGGSGGGSPPPPPPPPPLNMVPSLKLNTTGTGSGGTPGSAPPPPIHLEPDAQSYSQFISGTGLTVGTRQPLRINALMWNGVTDFSGK
ncbi:MAG: pilus assembly protein TadG-related protein, partial [Gemmataceae bacterium]